ncbi:MAG: SRPBCC domain-containing protein [Myxococcota bacterium]
MISDDNVTVSTRLSVDPLTAFQVFTDEVDAWWRVGPRFRTGHDRKSVMRFEPGVGGRLLEIFDEARDDAFELGRVRVWEPGARLVFDFRARNFVPGQITEVEIRFEPDAGGTRVTLEHRGWDRIPPEHPARHGLSGGAFTSMIGLFWADLLVSARAHASKSHPPRKEPS